MTEHPTTATWARKVPNGVLAAELSIFKDQLGLATRAQLLERGVTPGQVRFAVAQGRWARCASGLYALATWPDTDKRRLLAACLVTEGVASHASAAWVWGLLEQEPKVHSISVGHGRRPIRRAGRNAMPSRLSQELSRIVVHHSRDLSSECTTIWRGTPTTKPLRSLVDLAGNAPPHLLDTAIDVALARKLVTVSALIAEAARLKKPGRRGPAQLMTTLNRRGFAGAPTPSVLESRTLRLLKGAGVNVNGCETVVDGGRYRLDIEVGPHLFLEVDGYAYHWSAEHKRHDDVRRNRLGMQGQELLVYDWTTVMRDGRRLVSEVKLASEKTAPGSQGSPAEGARRTVLA